MVNIEKTNRMTAPNVGMLELTPVSLLAASSIALLLAGCASTNNQASSSCPNNAAGLDNLQTESRVIECLGKSEKTTSKPDGRHTALYRFDGGLIVVFLFNKDGSVIRNRAYKDSLAQ